jgi:hypothetical protein
MNQSREAHHSARPIHSPEGPSAARSLDGLDVAQGPPSWASALAPSASSPIVGCASWPSDSVPTCLSGEGHNAMDAHQTIPEYLQTSRLGFKQPISTDMV